MFCARPHGREKAVKFNLQKNARKRLNGVIIRLSARVWRPPALPAGNVIHQEREERHTSCVVIRVSRTMRASRGIVSRAASALLFAFAAAMALSFPGTAAEDVSGFARFGEVGVEVAALGETRAFSGGAARVAVEERAVVVAQAEGNGGIPDLLHPNIPKDFNTDIPDNAETCGYFNGTTSNSAVGPLCLGIATSQPFCVIGGTNIFPCNLLFPKVRECNAPDNADEPAYAGRLARMT